MEENFRASRSVKAPLTPVARPCAVVLGLVLLTAGIGKALGQPESTLALEGIFFAPAVAAGVARLLPWLEIGLGVLLLAGVLPRVVSALSVGLISCFVTSNVWLLTNTGQESITCGECFGVWEKAFGSMSPLQALVVDVALLGLALTEFTAVPAAIYPFRQRPWRDKKI